MDTENFNIPELSLPSRERGLKFTEISIKYITCYVAPFAGAWIEINRWCSPSSPCYVAPFAGAWIEIQLCGQAIEERKVAPFAGAWIEIKPRLKMVGSSGWVAPFAGAWIEICHSTTIFLKL